MRSDGTATTRYECINGATVRNSTEQNNTVANEGRGRNDEFVRTWIAGA